MIIYHTNIHFLSVEQCPRRHFKYHWKQTAVFLAARHIFISAGNPKINKSDQWLSLNVNLNNGECLWHNYLIWLSWLVYREGTPFSGIKPLQSNVVMTDTLLSKSQFTHFWWEWNFMASFWVADTVKQQQLHKFSCDVCCRINKSDITKSKKKILSIGKSGILLTPQGFYWNNHAFHSI